MDQSIFSLELGLVPIWTRIEALSKLESMISADLRQELILSAPQLSVSTMDLFSILQQVDVLSVCCSNARRFLHEGPKVYVERVFQVIRLCLRRSRMHCVLDIVDRLRAANEIVAQITRSSAVGTISNFRENIDAIPSGVVAVTFLHEKLARSVARMREEVVEAILRASCERYVNDFSNQITQELSELFGLGPTSILLDDAAFWYCSSIEAESSLVEHSTAKFMRDHFAGLMAGETWEENCRSCKRFEKIIYHIRQAATLQVPVLHEDLVDRMTSSIVKLYWLFVFMSFCGSDFAIIFFDERGGDLESMHEGWLRMARMPITVQTIRDPKMEESIKFVNKIKRRASLSVKPTHLFAATESVKTLGHSAAHELEFAIYSTLVDSGLAHAFNKWRETLLESVNFFDSANEHLVHEICAFLNFFASSTNKDLTHLISVQVDHVVVQELFTLLVETVRFKSESLFNLIETTRDLQAKLASVGVPVEQPSWTLVYECIHMMSMKNAQDYGVFLPWATEQTTRGVPLKVLTAIVIFCEQDEETRIQLIEALEHQVINLCSTPPRIS